jgi:hypothetical protein
VASARAVSRAATSAPLLLFRPSKVEFSWAISAC